MIARSSIRTDLTALLGRMLLVALFLIEASNKITGYGGALTFMEHFGVPGALLPLAIAFELSAGLLILVGWHTRLIAYALGGFCVTTALIFHANLADIGQSLHFWKDFAIAGGLLQLAANGPGRWSIDNKRLKLPMSPTAHPIQASYAQHAG